MALWDSADLLAKCKLHARRPTVDESMLDASWYILLTEAQAEVFPDLFTRYPDLQYSAPILLTSADGGKTYVFGLESDGATPIRPMGHAEIYPNPACIPDSPLLPGIDFLIEGALIRMTNNLSRSFSGGPYARFVARPDTAIDAGHAPILFPKNARMLLVWKALEAWASRPGSGMSPNYYIAKYTDARMNIWTELATEYNEQAGQAGNAGNNRWWTTGDLLRSGQFNG